MYTTYQEVPSELLEIKKYAEPGFKSMIDYNSWRVAILNYIDELNPNKITKMEKHNETDEVFVLLKGEFILYLKKDCQNSPGRIYGIKLEPFKLYNVRRGVWHTHTLSENCSILIVENQNTSEKNSSSVALTEKEQITIRNIAKRLFSN